MFKFTICFIKQGDRVLVLNRQSPEWMGAWNGVGGKIDRNETPLNGVLREVHEETGIVLEASQIQHKGYATWHGIDGSSLGGMYIFLAELPETVDYKTPIKTDEGILDWKDLSWLLHPKNRGVADLKYYLSTIIEKDDLFDYRFTYDDNETMIRFEKVSLGQMVE